MIQRRRPHRDGGGGHGTRRAEQLPDPGQRLPEVWRCEREWPDRAAAGGRRRDGGARRGRPDRRAGGPRGRDARRHPAGGGSAGGRGGRPGGARPAARSRARGPVRRPARRAVRRARLDRRGVAGVVRRSRLDAELVRRGLARSREQAAELVHAGRVRVGGHTATKPATGVDPGTEVLVEDDPGGEPAYASRGGHKLAGALDAFGSAGLTPHGRRCLDAGASTGGFTDVLLRRGARAVVAVDVGYGQLAWRLRTDPRVVIHDRTNVREL